MITGAGITGTDYSLSAVTMTIADGESTASATFTVLDDNVAEGMETATLSIFSPSARLDLGEQIARDITIADNDAGFTLNTTSVSVSESESTDSFTVVLDGAPLSDVVFFVSSDDTGEARVAPATLMFTPSNWDTAQTVTVTGVDDVIVDGDQTSTVTVSIDVESSDNAFDLVADQTVSVTTTDNVEFTLDVDDDGNIQALTDGILLIRYLAGFTGDSLVSGAVNESGGQRTAAADIIAWLDPHRTTFMDVDGDGESTALGDGILLLRFIAGFTGDALIAGAVNENGTRPTAEQVESWLNQFTGQGGGSAATANGPVAPRVDADPIDVRPAFSRKIDAQTHGLTATNDAVHRLTTNSDWRADLRLTDHLLVDSANRHRRIVRAAARMPGRTRSGLFHSLSAKSLELEELDFVFKDVFNLLTADVVQ